ncbi:MAG TPA: FAD-dependent monooxygenase [Pseudonocardiaceae bacterium]|nr:FAD-dependent monooxygenase [Pseudonocardiaceae bacterium]
MLAERSQVVVVGAGLAGLATTVFAAANGADVLLVEKHPVASPHPRAVCAHPRSEELLATVGLTEAIGLGQDRLEALLRMRACEFGARVHPSTELVSFRQDPDGVTVRLLDRWTERLHTVHADYLVAADGWRSPIRRELGITRPGHTLRSIIGVVYRLGPDGDKRVLNIEYRPERGESILDFPVDRVARLIHDELGDPAAEPVIRDISAWTAASGVAARFREGRVFLVGDAARAIPPERGIGADAAIADGFDLGWKLASVRTGQAGPGLLDSYQAERRSFAQAAVAGVLDADELLLGLRCRSNAIVAEDNDPAPAEDPARPSGRPGFPAPRVPLVRNGTPMSTVDLFGTGWVLLTGQGGGIWHAAADHAADVLAIRLRGYGLGPALADPTGTLTERYGIGEAGASLIRPDGVVAWRTGYEVTDPAATLLSVLGRLLDRRPVTPKVAPLTVG